MSQDALLLETNRILGRLLEIQEAHLREAEESAKEAAEYEAEQKKRDEALQQALAQRGLDPRLVEGSDENWDARYEAATAKSRQKIEEAQAEEEKFREALLTELRIQSELLTQIAKRLES